MMAASITAFVAFAAGLYVGDRIRALGRPVVPSECPPVVPAPRGRG
jgi:hypothetical protein